jgi:hypothetical protein
MRYFSISLLKNFSVCSPIRSYNLRLLYIFCKHLKQVKYFSLIQFWSETPCRILWILLNPRVKPEDDTFAVTSLRILKCSFLDCHTRSAFAMTMRFCFLPDHHAIMWFMMTKESAWLMTTSIKKAPGRRDLGACF